MSDKTKVAYTSDDGDYLLEGLHLSTASLFKGPHTNVWSVSEAELVREADPFPELKSRLEEWHATDADLKQEVGEELKEVAELMQGLASKTAGSERAQQHAKLARAIEAIPVAGPRSFGSRVDHGDTHVLVWTYDGPDQVGAVSFAWAPKSDAWTVEFEEGENPFYIQDIGEARAFTFEEVIGQLESWLRPVKASSSSIKQKWMQVRNYFEDMVNEITADLDDLKNKIKQGSTYSPNDEVARKINQMGLILPLMVKAKDRWGAGPKGDELLEVFLSDGQTTGRVLFAGVNQDNWIVKESDYGLPWTVRAKIKTPDIYQGIAKWAGDGLQKAAAAETAATERGDLHTDADGEEFEPVTIQVSDIPVLIEVPAGGTRAGEYDGQPWSHEHEFPYGEIPGTEGADGDPIDVILGPLEDPAQAFIIEQLTPEGEYDEDKVMLGFESIDEAEAAYDTTYGESPMERGETTTHAVEDLKEELFNSDVDLTEGLAEDNE